MLDLNRWVAKVTHLETTNPCVLASLACAAALSDQPARWYDLIASTYEAISADFDHPAIVTLLKETLEKLEERRALVAV